MKRIIPVGFAVCVCLVLSSATTRNISTHSAVVVKTAVSESNATTSWFIKQDTFACTTEAAFDEMMRACNRKDQGALERLASRGTLALLKKGTQIEMVKFGMGKCRIQVVSGPYRDIYFYVVTDHIGKK